MRPAVRRPLQALAVSAVAVAGWLGVSPLLAAPTPPIAKAPPPAAAISTPVPAATAAASVPAPPSAGPYASTLPTAGATPVPTPRAPDPTAAPGSAPVVTPLPRIDPPKATIAMDAALDGRLQRLLKRYGLPGVSAAIVFADGSSWIGTAGLADVAARRPVTSETQFAVASVSKTFTAALVLGLVEDGRLGLDSSVASFLPGLHLDPAITVRQLLDHTSGLRDYFFNPSIDAALLKNPSRVWTPKDALRYLGKPYGKPGKSWHYSNTNYLLLGMLAEAVGGAPVADQLERRFFTPLGLDHTTFQAVDPPVGPIAHGYRFTGADPALPAIDLSDGTDVVPFTSVVTAAGAAGSIATTADDLAHWARDLYGGRALRPAALAMMLGDIDRTAKYKPAIGYGLGVQSIEVEGHPTLGHSGRLLGFRAVVRWLPDEGIAIAVLTNQSRTDPNLVLRDLLRVGLEPRPDCFICNLSR